MKKIHWILLVGVLATALFFRTYQLRERMSYAHDADLYGWIVKDIVVNHHFRLIGQLTSADGIFVGPLFYYLIIPFFLLGKMDPFGVTIFITIIGILSVFSYFIVFSRLFGREVGLIAAFLDSFLASAVNFDRRAVPNTPANLWTVWYFYTVFMIARGNYSVLPLLGFLTALIWHIHIALFPALAAVPVAMLLSRKWPTVRQVYVSLIVFVVSLSPLIIFEFRHGFGQTISLISNFSINHGGGVGLPKLDHVANMVAGNILYMFAGSRDFFAADKRSVFLIILVVLGVGGLFVRRKLLSKTELIPMYAWAAGVVGFYSLTSSFISEYYFNSLEIIFVLIASLFLFFLYHLGPLANKAFFCILFFVFGVHLTLFLNQTYKDEYSNRRSIARFIASDSKSRGLPCVAVSYITLAGEDVGFRYFFWLENLHVNQPKSGSPVYTIVYPESLADVASGRHFGRWEVIPPSGGSFLGQIVESCSGDDANLTDPMFGYVE